MRDKSNKGTLFTILFIAAAFLGDKIVSLDVGFKLSPFRIMLVLLPLSLLLLGSGNPLSLKNKKSPSYGYLVFMRFWVFYSLLLLPFCNDFEHFGYNYLSLVSGYLFAWLVYKYITTEESVFRILSIFEYVAFLLTLVGIYEMITGNYRFVDEMNATYYDTNSAMQSALGIRVPISVFGNPNDFSLFLLFAVCVSNMMRHLRKRFVGRALSTAFQILFTLMTIATLSRAAAISLVVIYGYFIVVSFKNYGIGKKFLIVVLALLFSSSIVSWIVMNQEVIDVFLSVDVNASEGSDYIRISLIKNGLVFLTRSFFLGVGLGNIEYNMLHHAVFDTREILNIHNWWFEVLVSSGVIVFVWYIRLYIKRFLLSLRVVRSTNANTTLYQYNNCVVSILLAFIIGSISSSSIFSTSWMWAMFAVIFIIPTKAIQYK